MYTTIMNTRIIRWLKSTDTGEYILIWTVVSTSTVVHSTTITEYCLLIWNIVIRNEIPDMWSSLSHPLLFFLFSPPQFNFGACFYLTNHFPSPPPSFSLALNCCTACRYDSLALPAPGVGMMTRQMGRMLVCRLGQAKALVRWHLSVHVGDDVVMLC